MLTSWTVLSQKASALMVRTVSGRITLRTPPLKDPVIPVADGGDPVADLSPVQLEFLLVGAVEGHQLFSVIGHIQQALRARSSLMGESP